jgi:hypothetical protein
MTQRPFTPDIISRLNQVIDSLDGSKKNGSGSNKSSSFKPVMAFV